MKQKDIIQKYQNAEEIYLLTRKKVFSVKEKIFDWAVVLLSPIPGIVEEADAFSDMGTYYLVAMPNRKLLIRDSGSEFSETDITENYEQKGRSFVFDGNRFTKISRIFKTKNFNG